MSGRYYRGRVGIGRGNSVFLAHEQWQYTGVGFQRCGELPPHIVQATWGNSEIFDLVKELDSFSVQASFDQERLLKLLKGLLCRFMVFEPRRTSHEYGAVDEDIDKFASQFYELGGCQVLVRILMFGTLLPHYSRTNRVIQEDEYILRIKSLVLEILTKLSTSTIGKKVTDLLLDNDETLNYLFTLMAHKKTFINACSLLEDMLQARREVLDLHRIHNLRRLLHCLDDNQLGNFCRILAVAISDLDIYENKSSLYAQNKQKRSKGFLNLRDINQELLLSFQDLLPRLVKLAIAKDYAPPRDFDGLFVRPSSSRSHSSTSILASPSSSRSSGASSRDTDSPRSSSSAGRPSCGPTSELDCWMSWIDRQMHSDTDTPAQDDLDTFIGAISEPSSEHGPFVLQQGLLITEELVQRVEVVYVLGLFLLGKHRKKVQRKLADLKLAPGLSDLFDQFIWKCQMARHQGRHRLRGHNAACECSPEVALKIQFLRLVHSFCDHSDYKHLLLSKKELDEVKLINSKAGPLTLTTLDSINKSLMCKGPKGLLTKIVEVMKREPTTSTFRFWLARAVESYLRGDTSYCDQIFLMRRGLLQHVASNIVDHEIRHKEILQSSFDLLGELIKFNMEAFQRFDSILSTQDKFDKFIATVNKNLVDSNMFIRSLVLSLEHFNTESKNNPTDYANRKDCRLLTYISDFGQQLDYLSKLIKLITVQNLTQENVSCLNTTLVFLMFANQKNELPRYLQALQEEKEDMLDVNGSSIMHNFRELLVFWQDHYLHKDKDCSALEKSSRISFSYWKQTVATLVSEDKNAPTSVAHYVAMLPGTRTN